MQHKLNLTYLQFSVIKWAKQRPGQNPIDVKSDEAIQSSSIYLLALHFTLRVERDIGMRTQRKAKVPCPYILGSCGVPPLLQYFPA